ncbi:MAG: signal recognition particle-docking protein FtsY [Thermochromatium sp.]
MFGFSKKRPSFTPSESRSIDSGEPSPPPDISSAGATLPPTSGSPDTPKKPWFGKLFRTHRPTVAEPEPTAAPAAAEPMREPAPSRTRSISHTLVADQSPAWTQGLGKPSISVTPRPQIEPGPEPEAAPKRSALARLRERLSKSRAQLGDGIGRLLRGRSRIDEALLEELETLLITADVGLETTTRLIADLSARVKRNKITDPEALFAALKEDLRAILRAADGPVKQPAPGRPQVILVVGVNGVGKTTTIGKLAKRLLEEGNSVMLAAGDTFRAAAVEQLQVWGERNGVPVIAQHTGADSASVIFDALQAATARGFDVLIADTAGRLHTKSNLMDELAKVARVLKKIDSEAPHEVMLVVDATTGQNALSQAEHFHRALGLTGITITKLDGTAKGGILFAIAERLRIPIRFVGVGEGIEDLRPFDPDEFVAALLG